MSKSLRHIIGLDIPNFPIKLNKVGDLLYFEGSLMGVYCNDEGSPFIFDWVELNNNVNRWLVYEVEIKSLADYINGKISHFSLINNPKKDLIFLIDKNIEGIDVCCKVVSPKNLPYEYLPKNNIYFDEDESKKLDNIKTTFNLKEANKLKEIETSIFNILDEAEKNETELINLHFKSSKNSNVGFGKIKSSILGEILTDYSKLSRSIAINLFDKKTKSIKKRRKKGELDRIIGYSETELIYTKAASYSVFLKPITNEFDLFDTETNSEKILTKLFEILNASLDANKLKEIKNSLDNEVLQSYLNLIKGINSNDLTLCVQYANPANKKNLSEVLDIKKTKKILNNLNILESGDKNTLIEKGIFKALDVTNYSFKFESLKNEISLGKFSDSLKSFVGDYNLKDTYQVTFEINEVRKSNKIDNLEKISIIKCEVL